jgi:hypothetical protein
MSSIGRLRTHPGVPWTLSALLEEVHLVCFQLMRA